MKHAAGVFVFAAAVLPFAASAQTLTPQQAHGRQIMTQNCNVCHLPGNPGNATYGPPLNKGAANGDDKLMKEVIQNGLVKMPGWKYALKDSDIDDIIAYARTLPLTVPPPPAARRAGATPAE
jgi:mono/diheme cytochrome c family protein